MEQATLLNPILQTEPKKKHSGIENGQMSGQMTSPATAAAAAAAAAAVALVASGNAVQ